LKSLALDQLVADSIANEVADGMEVEFQL